jgi:hypothetical protein
MRRAAIVLLLVAAPLAGCGGTHTTEPANTGSRNVTKPLERPLVVKVGAATARLRRASNTTTRITFTGNVGTAELELDRGSCGAKSGLQRLRSLAGDGPWTIDESLTALTASPLAVVVRKAGSVVACGNVRSA